MCQKIWFFIFSTHDSGCFWIKGRRNQCFQDYFILLNRTGANWYQKRKFTVRPLHGRLFDGDFIELNSAIWRKVFFLITNSSYFFKIKVSFFSAWVCYCQFTVDHDYFFVILQYLKVAFLEFYDQGWKESSFFPVESFFVSKVERFGEGKKGDKRLWNVIRFELYFCL